MHAILFGLGLFATAIGAAMIGYGIPINEFSLGNTLIIAGTVSASGGLVLVGLAAAVRQLRRIAELLAARPMPRADRPAESAEPQLAGAARAAPQAQAPHAQAPGRIPFPPKPAAPAPEVPPPEPRLSGSPPTGFAGGNGEQQASARTAMAPMAPVAAPSAAHEEEVLVSPLPARASARATRLAHVKPSEILASARPRSEQARQANGAAAAVPEAEPLTEAPQREPADRQPPNFDALWPVEARPARAPRPTERPQPGEAPPAVAGPAARLRSAAAAAAQAPEPAPAAAQQAPILKSGVVDGMAYTLYADGSIEAQLPQGMVRFGSIAELRNHIEQNS